MTALYNLLILVLSLKVAILGCDPSKCSDAVKASMLAQTDSILEYVDTSLAATSSQQQVNPPVDTPQTATTPAPQEDTPVVVDPQFIGTPAYTIAQVSPGLIDITYTWETNVPVLAKFSLCEHRDECAEQTITDKNTYTTRRPATGVEWIEIRLSDTTAYMAQRPQL